MNILGPAQKDLFEVNFRSSFWPLPVKSQERLNKSEALKYCQHYFPNSTFPYRLDQLVELGFDSLRPSQFRERGILGPSPWFGVSYDPVKKTFFDDLTGLGLQNDD